MPLIQVIEDPDMLDYFKSTMKTNELLNVCKHEISDEFLEEVLEDSQYAVVHYINDNSSDLRGFALLTQSSDKNGEYLYIDLICNLQNHPMNLRSQIGPKTSGKDIINTIIDLAISKGIHRIKLAAIENVITYYNKLGFELDFKPNRPKKIHNIISMLKNKDPRIHDLGYDKLAIYQPDYFSEKNAAKPKEELITDIKDKGIPMTIYLNNHNQMQNAGRKTRKVRKGRNNRKTKHKRRRPSKNKTKSRKIKNKSRKYKFINKINCQ